MPFSFSTDGFIRIIDGARRIQAQAASHERQMERLLTKTQSDVTVACAALAELPDEAASATDPCVIALRAQLQRNRDRVATALALVPTGGTDFHGDTGTYADAHAALVVPDPVGTGLLAVLSGDADHA